MVEVRRSTVVDAPIEDVWAILRDFNGHDRWHPAVAASEIEDGLPSDLVGAVRDFRLTDGSRIREQLLALSDRDFSFTYCILEAPLPLMGYVATVRLKRVTDGNQTYWEWRSSFAPPAAERARLTRLVAEDIYEAGFRAIRSLLQEAPQAPSRGRRAQAQLTPAAPTGPGPTARAIVMDRHGGPEVLRLRTVRVPEPGPREVRIRQHAIGVNYIDVYCRTGYFDLVPLPGIPGMEAAGVIEAVGSEVTQSRVGERVGYACAPTGAYTELRTMSANLLVRLPETLSFELAAASLLKGITASFLLHDVYALKAGDTILVHAAAGGVGTLLCQWAASLGATVIGTVSTEEKAARAREAGSAHVIVHTREGFADAVMRITGGRGVDAVFDAVGRATFEDSLRSLKPRGHLVSFGQASGDIGAYEIGRLAAGSVTLSRPNYGHYTDSAEAVSRHANRLFEAIARRAVSLREPTRYALGDAPRAHADLEARRTTGSLILVP